MSVKIKVSKPASTEAPLPFSLQLIALDDVVSAKGNAKLHPDSQVDSIIKSIQEFGFRDPIALSENLEIVEGHGRVAALRKMGATAVPALVFKDMTPTQIKAYRIAHNQLTLSTGFDIGVLSVELRDLEVSGMDLSSTGFSLSDLDLFELQAAPEVVSKPSEKPNAPSDKEEVITPPALTVSQYIMLFDAKEQQSRWTVFLKYLKANIQGDTIAERVDNYLKAQGF